MMEIFESEINETARLVAQRIQRQNEVIAIELQ